MANRPVFIPRFNGSGLVDERPFEFRWAPGFSPTQKRKNIRALHEKARESGLKRILEISSKSEEKVGRRLSAFSLRIELSGSSYPLESVYQSTKVFDRSGGPFPDIRERSPREAKAFIRAYRDEDVVGFELEGRRYPLTPRTAFYDWLYIRSLAGHADWVEGNVRFDAFTDIEFNPRKQVNCQARAFAEFRSLLDRSELGKAADDFDHFASLLPSEPTESPKARSLPLPFPETPERGATHGTASRAT